MFLYVFLGYAKIACLRKKNINFVCSKLIILLIGRKENEDYCRGIRKNEANAKLFNYKTLKIIFSVNVVTSLTTLQGNEKNSSKP